MPLSHCSFLEVESEAAVGVKQSQTTEAVVDHTQSGEDAFGPPALYQDGGGAGSGADVDLDVDVGSSVGFDMAKYELNQEPVAAGMQGDAEAVGVAIAHTSGQGIVPGMVEWKLEMEATSKPEAYGSDFDLGTDIVMIVEGLVEKGVVDVAFVSGCIAVVASEDLVPLEFL